jgi:hypothetical protein
MKEFTLNPKLSDLETSKTSGKASAQFIAVKEGIIFVGIKKASFAGKVKALFNR